MTISAKEKFNALSNATHIFALKEEGTEFKLIEVLPTDSEGATKAIACDADGVVFGVFTDSKSAASTFRDLIAAFGDDQPFIKVHVRETRKGQSVYYAEVV